MIDRLVDPTSKLEEIPKPPLLTRIKNALIHYYHGFRLFGLEVKIASRLFLKTLRGQSLSRREQKQVFNKDNKYIPNFLCYLLLLCIIYYLL